MIYAVVIGESPIIALCDLSFMLDVVFMKGVEWDLFGEMESTKSVLKNFFVNSLFSWCHVIPDCNINTIFILLSYFIFIIIVIIIIC